MALNPAPAEQRTVDKMQPRHAAAVEAVPWATFDGKTKAQRRQLEAARLAEVNKQAREAAVDDAAANHAMSPPRTRDERMAHLKTGSDPAADHALKRFSQGGDRHKQVELCRAARVFDPVHAKTTTQGKAFDLIEKLRLHHPLNNDMVIRSLKASWCNYKAKARLIVAEKVDILQWHCDCWLEHNRCLTEEKCQSADSNAKGLCLKHRLELGQWMRRSRAQKTVQTNLKLI
jgi:hypothetical protein